MTKRSKFVIFDGHALLHRGFHAIPYLTNKEGTPTNGVYGFVQMMLNALRELKPEYVAVAWDMPGKTFRHDKYEAYKATRKETDPDLVAQFDTTRELVAAFNIPLIGVEGYEADDVIGTLVEQYQAKHDVVVVTGDMDELQLVSPTTKIYTLRKGFSDTVIYDEAAVMDKYGVSPQEFIVYKALKGDSSDNIPGVAGIGDKTATELVSTYHSLDNMYKNLDQIKPAVARKLEVGRELAYMSEDLATIERNVPIEFDLKNAVIHDYDKQKVFDLFHKLEFKSLLNRLPAHMVGDSKFVAEDPTIQEKTFNRKHLDTSLYHGVTSESELDSLVDLLSKQKIIAFDTETTSEDPIDARLVGMSFAVKEGEAYYIPLTHVKADNLVKATKAKQTSLLEREDGDFELAEGQLSVATVIEKLKPVLESPKIGKVGHNIKYDYVVMREHDITLAPIVFDTMVAAYLVNPNGRAQGLSQLAYSELGISMIDIEELIGKKGRGQLCFDCVPVADAIKYAAEDADITLRLYNKLVQQITTEPTGSKMLAKLADVAEWPLIPVLGEMELAGIRLDTDFLAKLSIQYDKQIDAVQQKIWKYAGGQFNISSPAQVQEILFGTLKIDSSGLKKTKTGISTAASELDKLRGKHPVVDLMYEYRELTKLKSTYIDALPLLVKDDGRLHTSFNQTIAQTGRLSSTNPNLQNIPIRTELGREIRQAFVAEPGKVLVSADYSQIELRLAAELSGDKPMIEDFKSGTDIHTLTAAEMFEVEPDKVTSEQRRAAKTINFGVLYGMNPHGLSVATGFDYAQAKEFIDRYFELRDGVAAYIAKLKKQAHDQQYTETYYGRRRPCPDVRSSNFAIRAAAERAAVNMPLQGTAADMMKLAMVAIAPKLPEGAKLLLQIHDELIVECDIKLAKQVSELMVAEMKAVAPKFSVPIEVDTEVATNWGEL